MDSDLLATSEGSISELTADTVHAGSRVKASELPDNGRLRLTTNIIVQRNTPRKWLPHQHPEHELLWAIRGNIQVETPTGLQIVPPGLDLWIPADTVHKVRLGADSSMSCSWFSAVGHSLAPTETIVVSESPLLHQVLDYLNDPALSTSQRSRAEFFAFDLVEASAAAIPNLPLPQDAGLRLAAESVLRTLHEPMALANLALLSNRSTRSFTRAFAAETGLTFGQWRTIARVQHSLPLLAEQRPIETVARTVGFKHSGAFISAFRRVMGTTPGDYRKNTSQT